MDEVTNVSDVSEFLEEFKECDPEIGPHGSLEAAKRYYELLPEVDSYVKARYREGQDRAARNSYIIYGSSLDEDAEN